MTVPDSTGARPAARPKLDLHRSAVAQSAGLWLGSLAFDFSNAVKSIMRNRVFSLIVILTLGFGIGLNSAVFSVFHAVAKPLGYPDEDRLAFVDAPSRESPADTDVVSGPEFVNWRDQATSIERIAGYGTFDQTLLIADAAVQARVGIVSDDFWRIASVSPVLGRLPNPDERAALVVSFQFFQDTLGGDPTSVGRSIVADGRPATIVGVLPQDFHFQLPLPEWPGFEPSPIAAYRPFIITGRNELLAVVVKRKPEYSLEQVRAELELLREANVGTGPSRVPVERVEHQIVRARPLRDQLLGNAAVSVRILLGAVIVVLLLACATTANLLLARESGRRGGFAIRMALGADRTRVLRALVIEVWVLGLLAGAAGLALATRGIDLLVRTAPHALPRLGEATVDRTVFGFGLGALLIAATVSAMLPALLLSTANLGDALKNGAQMVPNPRHVRITGIFVTAQVAIAVLLLCGGALLVKNVWQLSAQPGGLRPNRILLLKARLSPRDYRDPTRRLGYVDQVLNQVVSIAGVSAASITNHGFALTAAAPVGRPASAANGELPSTVLTATSARFNDVFALPLTEGRWLSDTEQVEVVINRRFAQSHFPNESAIGHRLAIGELNSTNNGQATVVGVVENLRFSKLDHTPPPEIYISYRHVPDMFMFSFAVRTTSNALKSAGEIRTAASSVDRTQPIFDVQSLQQSLNRSIALRLFNLTTLAVLAAVAFFTALFGIVGLLGLSLARRQREIGLRLALGARSWNIAATVAGEIMKSVLIGSAVGLTAVLMLSRFLQRLLYDLSALDISTHLTVIGAVVGLTLSLVLLRAARAAGRNPVSLLHHPQ